MRLGLVLIAMSGACGGGEVRLRTIDPAGSDEGADDGRGESGDEDNPWASVDWGDAELGHLPDFKIVLAVVDASDPDAAAALVITDSTLLELTRVELPASVQAAHIDGLWADTLGRVVVWASAPAPAWLQTGDFQRRTVWPSGVVVPQVWTLDPRTLQWSNLLAPHEGDPVLVATQTGQQIDLQLVAGDVVHATPWGLDPGAFLMTLEREAAHTAWIVGVDLDRGEDERFWELATLTGAAEQRVIGLEPGITRLGHPTALILARADDGPTQAVRLDEDGSMRRITADACVQDGEDLVWDSFTDALVTTRADPPEWRIAAPGWTFRSAVGGTDATPLGVFAVEDSWLTLLTVRQGDGSDAIRVYKDHSRLLQLSGIRRGLAQSRHRVQILVGTVAP
jgi:hypothetical protein